MARLLLLAVVALLVYVILRTVTQAFFTGLRGAGRTAPPPGLRDHLVKDPVCETYIPLRSAIARTAGSDTYYFCSPVCAEKFRVRS